MSDHLKILIVEDIPEDAELLLIGLRDAGYELDWVRVDNEPDYRKQLNSGLDVIFSDYFMPHFSGSRALEVLKETKLDIPFIIISGSIGEETAVEAMKHGVSDYLLKDRLARLGPSVIHVLEESRHRREKDLIMAELRESERLARAALNALTSYIVILNPEGVILDYNQAWEDQAIENGADISRTGKGVNYLSICDHATGQDAEFAQHFAEGIRRVIRGEIEEFMVEYPCHTPVAQRWYAGKVSRFPGVGPVRVVVSHENITERKLSEEQITLQAIALDAAANAIVITDHRGIIHWVNPEFTKMTGYSAEEVIGKNPRVLKSGEHDTVFYKQMWNTMMAGLVWKGEITNRRKDGSLYSEEMTITPLRDESGAIRNYIAIKSDITARIQSQKDLQKFNRALRMLSDCNEVLIRADDERELLDEICHVVVDIGGYQMAWVGYALDDDAKTIKPMASVGQGREYLDGIEFSWSGENVMAQGPASRSIRFGEIVMVEDVTREPSFAPWLERATRHDLRSFISIPLRNNTKIFGLLGLYSSQVQHLGEDEVKLLKELADDLAFGIGNIRSRNEQRQIQQAVVKLAEGVSARSGTAFFEQLALNMTESVGADAGFLARILPGPPPFARTFMAIADGRVIGDLEHALEHSPSQKLLEQESFLISDNLAELYPDYPLFKTLPARAYVGRQLKTSSGQVIGFLAVLFQEPLLDSTFITSTLKIFASRVVSELERQESENKILQQASLLDKAQDQIFVIGLDDVVTYWNKSAEQVYGWTSAEAVGRSIIGLIYDEASKYEEIKALILDKGEWTGEIPHRTKSGEVRMMEVRKTLVRDNAGKPQSILAINTDITERKKLEQQFFRAQRLESIGTLAGGIAHDLNNVLAPIIMSIDLLKLTANDPESQDILESIGESAKRGADMVSQVLSFARGMEGKRVEIQPKHLINNMVKIIKETFPKDIEIQKNMGSHHWTCWGDPTQLHQVLLNLCVNARDAMPDGGKLTITVDDVHLDKKIAGTYLDAKPGPYICLQVEDTGMGIPRDHLDKIFDPFFTTKEVGKGTGLGLSTSLSIVKGHQGFIRVSSRVGKGTRFRIYLPAQTSTFTEERKAESVDLPRGNGETILVVDDEASIRQITRQTLETFGYRVVLASDGAEAALLYAQSGEEIAAVVMDMMMPIMDGPSAIQALIKLNPKVRIIAASGLNANANLSRAAEGGVKHFLTKPYNAETLLKVMEQVLSEKT